MYIYIYTYIYTHIYTYVNTYLSEFEGFFLEFSSDGGANWYVAKDWAKGINLSVQSNTTTPAAHGFNFTEEYFLVERTNNFTLTNQTRIRFRTNLKDPSHALYFADVQISGTKQISYY